MQAVKKVLFPKQETAHNIGKAQRCKNGQGIVSVHSYILVSDALRQIYSLRSLYMFCNNFFSYYFRKRIKLII